MGLTVDSVLGLKLSGGKFVASHRAQKAVLLMTVAFPNSAVVAGFSALAFIRWRRY
jgi:hypothetical protein